MPASSDFKGLPLQTSLKVHSEPKGLFPAVTNTPRSTTSAAFQMPTKVNAGRCTGCRGAAVRVASRNRSDAGDRAPRASRDPYRAPQMRRPAGDGNSPKGAGHEGAPQHYRLPQQTGRNCERIGHIAQRAGCLGAVVPTAINLRGRALEVGARRLGAQMKRPPDHCPTREIVSIEKGKNRKEGGAFHARQ
jgi:hypothetical protein